MIETLDDLRASAEMEIFWEVEQDEKVIDRKWGRVTHFSNLEIFHPDLHEHDSAKRMFRVSPRIVTFSVSWR